MKIKYVRNLFLILVIVLLYVLHPYIHSIWSERTAEKVSAIYKAHQKLAKQHFASNQSFQPVAWNDVHITVRTTKVKHLSRYALLNKTWIKYTQENVHVITDEEDVAMRQDLGANLVVVNCGNDRPWTNQACKWGREFDTFIESNKKWWCRFDDDVYLNHEVLLQLLNSFNPDHLIYLGRQSRLDGIKSLPRCFVLLLEKSCDQYASVDICPENRALLWITELLVKFCDTIFTYDDVALGFLVTEILKVPFIETSLFHSHAEDLSITMRHVNLTQQATFSYKFGNITPFGAGLRPAFDISHDPTRFLSIHCMLHPDDEICPLTHSQP